MRRVANVSQYYVTELNGQLGWLRKNVSHIISNRGYFYFLTGANCAFIEPCHYLRSQNDQFQTELGQLKWLKERLNFFIN